MKRLALIGLLFFSINAQATNGYFSHGLGTKSKGMAGAGVALAEDAMGGALNPANMALVGSRLEIGGSLFIPKRGFRANNDASGPIQATPGQYDSENDLFLIPQFAYNHLLNETSSIGIAFAANGLNTEYRNPVFQYFGPGATEPTGVDLYQFFVHVPYSTQISPELSIGIAPVFALQAFRARGLEPFRFVSIHPNDVTNNGFDYSYGIGLSGGLNYRPTDFLSLGMGLQSRIDMSEFNDYRGLFAEEGDFDIPASLQMGISIHASKKLTLAADYQKIWYSDIPAIGNPNNVPLSPNNMGSNNGLGGGWKDADIVKLGVRWDYDSDTVLRVGYSHSSQVIPNTQALINILAPAVSRDHFSLGMTKSLDKQRELNLSLTYSPRETVNGTNPNTDKQTGELQMEQLELEITYGWRF
jgi:long-chain fatty acid transport protein